MWVLTSADWPSCARLPDALTRATYFARSLARFQEAEKFNQPIGSWDTSQARTMYEMRVLTLTDAFA